MKRLFALSGLTLALIAPLALAQSSPPPLPSLTSEQSATIEQRLDLYRQETEGRVARGEITADEADRLLRWREWQIAREVTRTSGNPPGVADSDVPPDYREPPTRDYAAPREYVIVEPPVYAGPVYRYPPPYYWAPRYYWGPAICAGGFGRHFGGRVCF